MNYVIAENCNKHIGFLHPERISEPSHTFLLDEKNLPEHVKTMTPEERQAYVDMKTHEKMLKVAAYMATSLVAMSEKDFVYAPYGFKYVLISTTSMYRCNHGSTNKFIFVETIG